MRTLDRLRNGKGFYLFDGVLIASVIFLVVLQRPSLQDYERRCRETADPKEKEKIALTAVDFLVNQDIPDSIAHQVNQAVASENLSLPPNILLFPETSTITNDSLAGWYDGLLTENLPKLYWMRRNKPDSVRGENFSRAKKIAAQADSLLNCYYWLPLMDFLDKADDKAWQRWRAATEAATISRQYIRASRYEQAQFAAAFGLQANLRLPDDRQKLDLFYRLQNALVSGSQSAFNIGLALADWIISKSQNAGYYLRAVSLQFNGGNQLFHLGRYDEALEKFKKVKDSTQKWRRFQPKDMQWYGTENLERMAAVFNKLGHYSEAMNYLGQYNHLAKDVRQKTLYHLGRGMAARLIGDLQTAEKELQAAIACGKGVETQGLETDLLNTWYAYLELGDLYLEYHLPERALFYFQSAKDYITTQDESFLAGEKLSDYWLHLAEAFVQNQEMDSAAIASEQAKKQPIDSPWLRVKNLFCSARVHENLGQVQKADAILAQAQELCQNYGMTIYEIDAILRQVALSFQTPKNFQRGYSEKDLENLIVKTNKSGAKQQLVHSLALAVEAAMRVERYGQAKPYADWLLNETEALSRLYDQEQRLIFFQHSTYEKVKVAVNLDLRLGKIDSAFIKLDYVKSRSLRPRLRDLKESKGTSASLPSIDLVKLRQHLQPEEAIVNYMVADDTLYTFVLTASSLQLFPSAITRHELKALVMNYLAELMPDNTKQDGYDEQRQRREFLKAIQLSHELYTKLIGKMAGHLETIKRLYIVPDEFLYSLPFNTLALQDGLAAEFLINHKAVMYLPAASLLFTTSGNTGTKDSLQWQLLASVDSVMYGAPQIFDGLAKFKNMKVTERAHWENQAAMETRLASLYQIYFFYAHAEANWDNPWQSYIQFPLQSPRQYGRLTYADIDSIDWRSAELVILAACETTGNRIYRGAGLSGLQRSFFSAGAKQVLATFWKVDAGQVASQMSDFLSEWDHSGDAVLALQKMQLAAIARLKNNPYLNYPHPRYWGAYNLTGTKDAAHIVPTYAASSVR